MKLTINKPEPDNQMWFVGDAFIDPTTNLPRIIVQDKQHFGLLALPSMRVMFLDNYFESPNVLMNWLYEVHIPEKTVLQKYQINEIILEVSSWK